MRRAISTPSPATDRLSMLWPLTAHDNRCLYGVIDGFFALIHPMMQPPLKARFLPAGDTALVVEFGDTAERALNDRVLALADAITAVGIDGVVEMVPTFRSLMIHYDPSRIGAQALARAVSPLIGKAGASSRHGRLWRLPAVYGGEFGPDLPEVAERTGFSEEAVVQLHTGVDYHVYTLGFLPGYPYMGDGPAELALPRRETPRIKVPMGSVCIAFRQAGVYSLESPGGWHLLGRTPVRLFDPRRENAVLLAPGDKVRFEPIAADAFRQLEARAASGELEVKPAEVSA
jgi:KipI family sensor histidine kinase inhibitor